jgi:DNA polymerase III gamma/tau subunit
MYEDLRKAVGDDQMSFSFDELLTWARPLVMVVDHRNKTPETMEVLQNEWTAYGCSKIAPLHRAFEITRLKKKLEMITEASDDATVQKMELEMEITRLESETLDERNQRKKDEEDRKKEEARQRKEEEKDRKKEEARKREEEEARQRVKEQEEQARQRKEEQEEQAPKARGKNMTFDDRMEDLKRFKETHGHANVTIR